MHPTIPRALAYWVHDWDPFLVQFTETIGIRYYGLAYLLGFISSAWLLHRYFRAGKSLLPTAHIADFMLCIILGVLIGGRLGSYLLYDGWRTFTSDPLGVFKICSPEQIPWTTSLKDSFRVLTRFLLNFYRRLGLDASYAQDAAPAGYRLGVRTDFCFAGRESFDILINGRKIGGNAQRRQRNVIFQHGSIPLSNHVEKGLSYMRGNFSGCEQGVVSLAECGVQLERKGLLEEITWAFSNSFAIEFDDYLLSSDEIIMSNNLKNNKYVADSWNLGGVGG